MRKRALLKSFQLSLRLGNLFFGKPHLAQDGYGVGAFFFAKNIPKPRVAAANSFADMTEV